MAVLSRDELVSALIRLGQLAADNGDLIQLLAVGGTIMVLELNTCNSTKDIDAVSVNDIDRSRLDKYVSESASERLWPPDWINAAKGFIVGPVRTMTILSGPGIELFRPEYVHLAAGKRVKKHGMLWTIFGRATAHERN